MTKEVGAHDLGVTLYFAYGSNLDLTAMQRRCPASTPTGLARLEGYRFIIGGEGYATVVPTFGAVVHGLVWRLAPADMAALDAYEEVTAGLYRKATLPVTQEPRRFDALVYLAANTSVGAPRPGYMEAVTAAAHRCGLPRHYCEELAAWRPRA